MDQISVLLNSYGDTASVWEDACRIQIFMRGSSCWEERESFPVFLDRTKPLPLLRGEIAGAATKMSGAKILVGRSIGGLAYQIFDRMGFQIVEAEHFSPDLLDRIQSEVGEAERKEEEMAIRKKPAPWETKIPGQYELDLVAVQKEAPDVSSKMALQPFFESIPFSQLTILCRHLPLWLTSYAQGKGWRTESSPAENGAERVTVFCGKEI